MTGEATAGRREGPDYDLAFAGERVAQAVWLRRELGLRALSAIRAAGQLAERVDE